MTNRAAFRTGAEAMRARIIAGIRRWWGDARRAAGHRWPGHPHWLETAIARIDVGELLRGAGGFDGGADALDADAEGGGQRQQGAPANGCAGSVDERGDRLRAKASILAPRRKLAGGDDGSEQVADRLGSGGLASHGEGCSGTGGKKLDATLLQSVESVDTVRAPNETTPAAAQLPTAEQRPRPDANPEQEHAMSNVAVPSTVPQLLNCERIFHGTRCPLGGGVIECHELLAEWRGRPLTIEVDLQIRTVHGHQPDQEDYAFLDNEGYIRQQLDEHGVPTADHETIVALVAEKFYAGREL